MVKNNSVKNRNITDEAEAVPVKKRKEEAEQILYITRV